MAPSLSDDLKAFKSLKIQHFEPRSDGILEKAREFVLYFKQINTSFTSLGIEDAKRRKSIFSLVEYDLTERVEKGVADAQVTEEADDWKKFSKKLNIYYQTEKLEEAARKQLSSIRQKEGQDPRDLKVEILQYWEEAGYGDTDKDKHVLQIFLTALKSAEVRLQYSYSQMPGRTPLTIEQVIETANVLALHNPSKNSYKTNKVGTGGRRFNYSKKFKNKSNQNNQSSQWSCWSCGSKEHQSGHPSCKAKGKKCRKCDKIGHFKVVCFQGSNRDSNRGSNQGSKSNYQKSSFQKRSYHSKKIGDTPEQDTSSSNPQGQYQSEEQQQLAELLSKTVHLN